MLKMLKWAYDLGIRHERVRISAHLQVHSTGARNRLDVVDDMFRAEMSKPKPNQKRLERFEFEKAVNHRVEEIIQDMFQSNDTWIAGASIMFPEDEHKGKVK